MTKMHSWERQVPELGKDRTMKNNVLGCNRRVELQVASFERKEDSTTHPVLVVRG